MQMKKINSDGWWNIVEFGMEVSISGRESFYVELPKGLFFNLFGK